MLYYLAFALRPEIGVFNVLTYHTVRAGAAALTAFLLCLFLGPMLIRRLRALKVGQHIRKEYVDGLHALHNHKSGTPTMGGALIILSTVVSLLLWSTLVNRLMIVAVLVLCVLGVVGFVDDYISLRRKHNKGLSARAKFAGQILVGLALGLYLYVSPVTVDRGALVRGDILDWTQLTREVTEGSLVSRCPRMEPFLTGVAAGGNPTPQQVAQSCEALNSLIAQINLYDEGDWSGVKLSAVTKQIIDEGAYRTGGDALKTLNRHLLADAFPGVFARPTANLHAKLELPGFKKVFIPLGLFYVFFVVLVIVSSSNAVNLTDGLDGLAIGASVMSLLAYTGIAYVVSRADWCDYLYLIYVPEASELTVFGAAMLGAGLGFLWFNSHPAEVFMGDTGSLALGGAIGTMAILTKQELLLILVGGLFVIEAASVIIQVVSYKLRGKRVFKMSPLHHHFELSGWSESKVVIRFWIIALLFALMSLGTLKLR